MAFKKSDQPTSQFDQIIKNLSGLPDAHHSYRAIEQVKAIKILTDAINKFNFQSTLLSVLVIFIAVLQLFLIAKQLGWW